MFIFSYKSVILKFETRSEYDFILTVIELDLLSTIINRYIPPNSNTNQLCFFSIFVNHSFLISKL